MRRGALFLGIMGILSASSLSGQVCVGSPSIGFAAGSATINDTRNCQNLFWCHPPEVMGVDYRVMPTGCDPTQGSCTMRGVVPLEFPGNHNNTSSIFIDSPVKLLWEDSMNNFVGACGHIGARIQVDDGETWIERSFTCGSTGGGDVFELKVTVCDEVSGCERNASVMVDMTDQALEAAACPTPPEDDCDDNCLGCRGLGGGGPAGAGGGGSAAGGGGYAGGRGTGPGALLRYKAGSIGMEGLPGSDDWDLGRFWSHTYAVRLFEDDDPAPLASRVFMVTGTAIYKTFSDSDGDDLYEQVSPSDEYRQLEKTGSGWTLTGLDGTALTFDTDGLWLERVDKNGNATAATYSAGELSTVSFPDGRQEDFAYASGNLATITEVGVDGTTSRTWTYSWSGQDLTRIDRPDGTALSYTYGDPAHPGYMNRATLIGTDAVSERIIGAWEYDASGNVVKLWRGAVDFASGVGRWEFAFDNPVLPAVTTITDPLGNISTTTWAVDRDSVNRKPKVTQIDGDCPVCGVSPNSQLAYDDAGNSYRVTEEVDGRGHVTKFEYDGNGRRTRRIEAFATPLERETTWTYDPIFPAFVATRAEPSTSGFPNLKTTTSAYDVSGDRTSLTLDGFEDALAFNFITDFGYNGGGQVTTIDPPGYGLDDRTTFTYDATRGNGFLILESRVDPLIGATTFGYDAFNRRTSVTDPNGVVTQTQYDALDRVRFVIQQGATPVEDLVTEHRYNVFGDLFQTVLPEGNVIEYGYDDAGRLTTVERKPDDTAESHLERVVYTLDGLGNRMLEEFERWTGTEWQKRSQTANQYTNRCRLDQTTQGFGGDEATTEYAYDCDGNLERIWDANHPSAGQTEPATTEYVYDELDRLKEVRQPWGGAGGGEMVVGYAYDVQDHLTQVTDGEGAITTYTYSDRDLMTTEVSEVSGTTDFTYNEHGELETRTDARGVIMSRTIDALDRVTLEDYPDDTLDVTYVYDNPLVAFSIGRLTSIERGDHAVDYAYDRFGRMEQDGDLTYGYDKNGNRASIGYPGSVNAIYTYDAADRQATLSVQRPGQPNVNLVSASSYEPAGPLASVAIGNGLTETRGFDTRYFPSSVEVDGVSPVLDWQYAVDDTGNITTIADALNGSNNRTYGYQDFQYYLIQGDGPWGDLAWTYDRIGNRLSETRDAVLDTYTYIPNAATGNSALLDQITLGDVGTKSFTYDAAGNQTQVDLTGDAVDRIYDDAGRMSRQERTAASASTDFIYDGRSFLRQAAGIAPDIAPDTMGTAGVFCDGFESGDTTAWDTGIGPCPTTDVLTTAQPTYSSEGILHRVAAPGEVRYVFYFGDRPVAQLASSGPLLYLTTDHLGTAILATDEAGSVGWEGGFEPFGADYSGASDGGVFLRLPGQLVDEAWAESGMNAGATYNVHRWYQPGTGRYNRKDPVGDVEMRQDNLWYPRAEQERFSLYSYVDANPLVFVDPLGLLKFKGCTKPLEGALSKAFKDACMKVGDPKFQNCCSKPSVPRGLNRLCKQNNRTVRCRTNRTGKCSVPPGGGLNCGWAVPLGRTIRICPDGFSPGCGPLGCTLVHEMTHQLGFPGEKTPTEAERCLGC